MIKIWTQLKVRKLFSRKKFDNKIAKYQNFPKKIGIHQRFYPDISRKKFNSTKNLYLKKNKFIFSTLRDKSYGISGYLKIWNQGAKFWFNFFIFFGKYHLENFRDIFWCRCKKIQLTIFLFRFFNFFFTKYQSGR